MSFEPEVRIPVMSTILALGALANILLVFCLAHTWKFWRQVKWYVILLTVGNVLDLAFTQGTVLRSFVSNESTWFGTTTGMCRFMIFLHILGPSLSAMAVAALALHVLLTSLTGCQGNRLRHALVLGLFVLLGLALPLAKVPLFKVKVYDAGYEQHAVCHMESENQESYLQLQVGESVAVCFFPIFVTLCCGITSAVLLFGSGRGNEKSDADKSDLILTALLGVALLVCCVPYHIATLVINSESRYSIDAYRVLFNLQFLMDCFCIVTAVTAIVFAYVHAYRTRGGEFLAIPGRSSDKGSGERQKLVN